MELEAVLPTLHVQLLGDFCLVYGESPVAQIDSPRLQSLLAYLVVHRSAPQSRQRLAFLFWPDSSEAQAHTNLRNLLHLLRDALPDTDRFLFVDAKTLQWRPAAPFTLDVADFERAVSQASSSTSLREAVNLYRGDLVPSCYDDWIVSERERLRQAFIEALEQLVRLLENQRDYRSASSYAERLLRHDPLREETYRQLMRLHALSGDRAGVLRVYQTCATVLRRELKAEVSPATREAYEQFVKMERQPVHVPELTRTPRLNNLPIQLTSFIGREQEITGIKQLLSSRSSVRLLTLTGAGGCGKTRLAIQVANDLLDVYQDGIWLVELAPISDPGLVPQTVATVLDVREQEGRTFVETLSSYLQSKELLLILDNCEHLLSGCAQLAEALLHVCPKLQILTTSTARLNIAGETVYLVPVLSLPKPEHLGRIEELGRSEAVRLFVERAASILPTFVLNQQNAAPVMALCQHLDGIPLAIELAAARVKILTVEQITERLDNRFRLLVNSSRTALPKHQTLRATMEWSWHLLSAGEQILFRRLSVFSGSFTLEAVEKICNDKPIEEGQPLDLLAHLIDKSLVAVANQAHATRFRLLETVREYAREKLSESGETAQVRERHLEFFLKLAEEVEPKLKGEAQGLWLERLEVEHDNLRAALQWSVKEKENAGLGLRLASALVDFWQVRGEFTEGRRWLEITLKQSHDTLAPWRAKALLGVGELAFFHGDFAASRSLLEGSLVIFRELGNKPGIAYSLFRLGITATLQCDLAAARSFFEDSLVIFREVGHQPGIAYVLYGQGHLAHTQGEWAAARVLLEESLMIFRELGDKQGIVLALQDLGMVMAELGDCALGRSILEESMAIGRELGSRFDVSRTAWALGRVAYLEGNYALARSLYAEFAAIVKAMGIRLGMLYLLTAYACLASGEGQFERMTRLLGAAEHLSNVMGAPLVPVERIEHDRLAVVARDELGEDAFVTAWTQGWAMTIEQAIEFASTANS